MFGPTGALTQNLSAILDAVTKDILGSQDNGPLPNAITQLIQGASGGSLPGQVIIPLVIATAVWIAGASIIASLVAAGLSFGALASAYAFSWSSGFTSEAVIPWMSNVFQGLQAGLMTGIGSAASQGGQQLRSIAGGAASFGRGLSALSNVFRRR